MFSKPCKPEIDHHIIKLITGIIALSLAFLTNYFSDVPLESISASYHQGLWSRDIFVGFLFAISAFLFAYNGRSRTEKILSKIAAMSSLGVALFPCDCGTGIELIPGLHYISAGIMFTILVAFCYSFYKRAISKGHSRARFRAYIYAICGAIITAAIFTLGIDFLTKELLSSRVSRLGYYCESAGLIAFGIAWLTASRTLPIITTKQERIPIISNEKNSSNSNGNRNK